MIRSQEPFPTSSVFLFLIVLLWPAFLHLSFFLFPREIISLFTSPLPHIVQWLSSSFFFSRREGCSKIASFSRDKKKWRSTLCKEGRTQNHYLTPSRKSAHPSPPTSARRNAVNQAEGPLSPSRLTTTEAPSPSLHPPQSSSTSSSPSLDSPPFCGSASSE